MLNSDQTEYSPGKRVFFPNLLYRIQIKQNTALEGLNIVNPWQAASERRAAWGVTGRYI